MLLVQAKEPLVIFGFRIIGEDHSRASLAGLHDQRFSGPGSDHSFDFGFVTSKRRYRCQKEQCHQTYQHRFSVHNCLPFFSLNSDGNVRRFSPRLNISAFLQTWPLIGSAYECGLQLGFHQQQRDCRERGQQLTPRITCAR